MSRTSGNAQRQQDAPFVSIIIPTYNAGSFLQEAVGSCLKIRGVDLEIIVVDDGSSDGAPQRLQQRYPQIHLHHLPGNSGSGSAGRNAGLALARGRYVKFLDQDDLLQPRGFRSECQEAMRCDADIVMAAWGVVAIDGTGLFSRQNRRIFQAPEPERLVEAILLGQPTPYTAAALYKRTYVGAERWDGEVAIIDDYDWFCRLALKGGVISRVDTVAYFWRLHPDSIQGRSHGGATIYRRLMVARCKVYGKVEDLLRSQGQLTRQRSQLLARRYYECLRCHARYAPPQARALLRHIRELDPDFVVDASCERDPRARRLIALIGLANFLRGYTVLQRLAAGVRSLRPPAVPAPGRG